MVKDIHRLINQMAEAEAALTQTTFIAPCVKGGQVQTRVLGMVYSFQPQPHAVEGWGLFQPLDRQTARWQREAELPQIHGYLQSFPAIRMRLVAPLQGRTWLAYPVNEGDVQQRLRRVCPIPVHLVASGSRFEEGVTRWDGRSLWWEDSDRRADPMLTDALRTAFRTEVMPEDLAFKGLTPEMRTAYALAADQHPEFCQARRDERRLRQALSMGGGTLHEFSDQDEFWNVRWQTSEGEWHTSAIAKADLTVMSAGICLAGEDQKFDLQSLVGVIEDADEW